MLPWKRIELRLERKLYIEQTKQCWICAVFINTRFYQINRSMILILLKFYSFIDTLAIRLVVTHNDLCSLVVCTAQKMKFSIQDFFNKCDQIRSFLRNWSLLLRKSFFVQWSRLLSFLSFFFEPNSIILIISSPISMLSLLSTKRSQTFEKLSLSFSSISFESHYW